MENYRYIRFSSLNVKKIPFRRRSLSPFIKKTLFEEEVYYHLSSFLIHHTSPRRYFMKKKFVVFSSSFLSKKIYFEPSSLVHFCEEVQWFECLLPDEVHIWINYIFFIFIYHFSSFLSKMTIFEEISFIQDGCFEF